MMGNTYAHVIEQSEKEWMKQWAKIVITLERAIPQSDAHHYLQEYSISLGPSEDPSTEQRGVMVIKSKSKTRAKQRKGAVANWKRVGKVTINALKKRGMTGEEMRCLMWGRESINTPVKIKRPTTDPLLDPQGPNLTGAFSGALTAALDVMAFTHDLDINSVTPGLNLTSANDKTQTSNQINTALNQTATGNALFGTYTQLADSQVPNTYKPIPSSAQNIQPNQTTEFDDPLRRLVICERNIEEETLKELANQAANLQQTEEISVKQNVSVKNLAGIFAGTDTFVKKVEENIKKKYAAFDSTDSEGCGEVPLLGRISRMRRAKSANLRGSAKSRASDQQKLFQENESSSSDNNPNVNEAFEKEKLDYADERIRHIKESLMKERSPFDTDSLRPINIDIAMGGNELCVTLSQTGVVKAEGSGQDLNSTPPVKHKKKRPKTAKNNRIAPEVNVQARNCHTAGKAEVEDPPSSPDPLEPWSTKGITNMNKILAWEEDRDSL